MKTSPKKKMTKKLKSFSRLSKEGKRVAIAKDVLVQLKAKKIIAKEGSYVSIPLKENEVGKQLQDLLPKKKCNCCALGSCFVSLVSIENDFAIKSHNLGQGGERNGHIGKDDFRSRLKKYFTQFQLDLIETAFEGTTGYIDGPDNSEQFEKAREFYYQFGGEGWDSQDRSDEESEQCLIGIMENIITNKGTFKP